MGIRFKLENQIKFLNSDFVKTSFNSEEISLVEMETEGCARLKVNTSMPSIFINSADDCDIAFMKDKVCADSILLQKDDKEQWSLRVIEFKKTLNLEKLIEARKQIMNAIFKSLTLKGCLGIDDFHVIEGYCAYRGNKVEESKNKNPRLLRDNYIVRAYNEWTGSNFKIAAMDIDIPLNGIQLDSQGYGEIQF